KSGALLGRIGHETTFECLLQSLKGGTKVNRRSHGRLCSPRSAGNANGCRSTPCTPCKCATGPGPGPRRGWYHRRKSSGVPSVLFAEEVDGQHRQRPGADDRGALRHEQLGVLVRRGLGGGPAIGGDAGKYIKPRGLLGEEGEALRRAGQLGGGAVAISGWLQHRRHALGQLAVVDGGAV